MPYELKANKETVQKYATMKTKGELQKVAETCMCFWMISDALDDIELNSKKWDGQTERRIGERRNAK